MHLKVKKETVSVSIILKFLYMEGIMCMERIFIGVAWPYANGSLHLGTLAGALLPGDIFGRYHRLKGNAVLMVSGSDEHGTPITITAEKKGVTPKEIVDHYHAEHVENIRQLGIKFENFSRTSNEFHKKVVQDFFLRIYENGYIYPKKMLAFFCPNCNRFLPDRYVEGKCPYCGGKARGDQCEECGATLEPEEILEPKCKICGATPVLKETEHLFFKLSAFEEPLLQWLSSKQFWRDNVLRFTQNFIKKGLKDRAITRDLEWGVEVPIKGYENKRIYVWFDAVIGYLSASMEWAEKIGEPEKWKGWWKGEAKHYYFLAKDNIPFHTIIWPAMLMAHGGLNLPYDVPANEYLTLSGEQFSKSRGIGIWIPDVLKKFDADAIRYYLAINMPEKHDTEWKWDDFVAKNNNELVAIYGNFIHRVLTFIHKNFGKIPSYKEEEKGERLLEEVHSIINEIDDAIGKCHFKDGMKKIMKIAQLGNRYLNESEPWKLIKEDREKCASVLHVCARIIKSIAIVSAPYMPNAADKIWKMLGYNDSVHEHRWEEAFDDIQLNEISSPAPLFRKLDLNDIIEEEFSKLDIRIARIIDVQNHPNADRLYVLKIDVGELGQRTIVAGLKEWYSEEDLKGRKIALLANLKPAKLRGITSEGMLLAADDGKRAYLLLPQGKEGSRIFVEGIESNPVEKITYDEFRKIKLVTKDGKAFYKDKPLKDEKGEIGIDGNVRDGCIIR